MSDQISPGALAVAFSQKLQTQFPTSYWPKYLFHYAAIENAVSILKEGAIYSRKHAKEKDLLAIDSAGPAIIDKTDEQYFGYARLYFRPKTPPLFRVEGFIQDSEGVPHCPVPIYFLFKWNRIFDIPGVLFSDGNLASNHSTCYADVVHLESLDFTQIYHNSPILGNDEFKRSIVRSRCAEIIVPDHISLAKNLSCIVCRSKAERETLLNLMPNAQRAQYSAKTTVEPMCFHRRRQYVESVTLTADSVRFGFSIPPARVKFRYHFVFSYGGRKRTFDYDDPPGTFTWSRAPGRYGVKLLLDSQLAYKGAYYPVDEPF